MAIDVSVFRLVSGQGNQPSLSYHLHITNLEDAPFEYLVEYWHRATFGDVHVRAGRFRDIHGTYSPTPGVFVATHRVMLLPHEGTVVQLAFAGHEDGAIDIRGHVRLRLPRRRATGEAAGVALVPQSDRPVQVMLHAESVSDVTPSISEHAGLRDARGYVVARFGVSGTLSPLRTATAVSLASGRALNEVGPDERFTIAKASLETVDRISRSTEGVPFKAATADIADNDRALALVELLTELSSDASTVDEVNRLLSDAKSRIQVRGATPRQG